MRFFALATDYDGTIAHHGLVDRHTLQSLERLVESGRRLIMVTGRRLDDLQNVFHRLDLFERVVVENGAVLYNPAIDEQRLLCEPTPEEFVHQMRKEVDAVDVGEVIVATWQPHESTALRLIREMNLELQIIFNKDAVMVLPTGVNKASGLHAALDEMGLSLLNTVGVGDAENDLVMLGQCGASAAVENALDTVKQRADIVLKRPRGEGVQDLIEQIIQGDLRSSTSLARRQVILGCHLDGTPFSVSLEGESVLVTGGPGGGKSQFAISFLTQLSQLGGQCVILDPEGDYQDIHDSIVLGTADRAPKIEEVIGVLRQPIDHCVVSFFSVAKDKRPQHFDQLHRALAAQRSRSGRPHWVIVDEAHYAAPRDWEPAEAWSHAELKGVMFVTAYQERISLWVMESVDWIISIAQDPREAILRCAELLGAEPPSMHEPIDNETHHALAWHRASSQAMWFKRFELPPRHYRHQHSYYDGEMDADLRFVFRGPEQKLELVAQNLRIFIQLARGIDNETWQYHLKRNDFGKWFADVIQDDELAAVALQLSQHPLPPKESRQVIIERILRRFDPAALHK
jgi:hydroxymethylpyrimidine pyrophosphatase-like HAD family hydrolase